MTLNATIRSVVISVVMSCLLPVPSSAENAVLRHAIKNCAVLLPDVHATSQALANDGWTPVSNPTESAIQQMADASLSASLHFGRIETLDLAARDAKAKTLAALFVKPEDELVALQSPGGHLVVLSRASNTTGCEFATDPETDLDVLFNKMRREFEMHHVVRNGVEHLYTAVPTVERLKLPATIVAFRYLEEIIAIERRSTLLSVGMILVSEKSE